MVAATAGSPEILGEHGLGSVLVGHALVHTDPAVLDQPRLRELLVTEAKALWVPRDGRFPEPLMR